MKAYYVRADTVVAYTYSAAVYCPECILKCFGATDIDAPTEVILGNIAKSKGIDRHDERSYDSGEFPKVIFRDQIEDHEICELCSDSLILPWSK